MPYEEDYKMWLEKALIRMNPDWICDEMSNNEFTHDWCYKYCGKDDLYITPKCLHMYYHHIARADRKTENCSEKPNNCEDCIWSVCNYNKAFKDEPTVSKMEQVDKDINVRSKDEPQTDMAEDIVRSYGFKAESYQQAKAKTEPQTDEHCETCRHKDECEGATYEYKNTEWWCLAYAPIDEPQTDCKECKYAWWNSDMKRYECSIPKCPYNEQTEPQTERSE